jgi:hypothetical protein
MGNPKTFGDKAAGLSNDLNMVHDPGLNQFIMIEGLATAHRVLLDTLNRLPYVG